MVELVMSIPDANNDFEIILHRPLDIPLKVEFATRNQVGLQKE